MAATIDEIETALLAPWLSVENGGTGEWTATAQDAIAFDNAPLEPAALAAGTPWMEVATSAGLIRKIGVGPVYAGFPTVTVSAHTPVGTGKRAARQLIDAAAALYRDRHISAGPSTMFAYAFSQPVEMPRDGFYKLTMQASFRLL